MGRAREGDYSELIAVEVSNGCKARASNLVG